VKSKSYTRILRYICCIFFAEAADTDDKDDKDKTQTQAKDKQDTEEGV